MNAQVRKYMKPASLLLMACLIAVIQMAMGRVWWCEGGDLWPWSWDIWSRHNSQHLVDPYTLSHIEHGVGLYVLLTLLGEKRTSVYFRIFVVALVEAVWEVIENTDWMIQRYRESTISLDYYGDSILNSVSDFGACLLGAWIAQRLPLWANGLLLIGLELVSLLWIRDSLLLNVVMLIWASEAIREWQMRGKG